MSRCVDDVPLYLIKPQAYTRNGDNGFSVVMGENLPKSDFVFEAIGALEELNARLGYELNLTT